MLISPHLYQAVRLGRRQPPRRPGSVVKNNVSSSTSVVDPAVECGQICDPCRSCVSALLMGVPYMAKPRCERSNRFGGAQQQPSYFFDELRRKHVADSPCEGGNNLAAPRCVPAPEQRVHGPQVHGRSDG